MANLNDIHIPSLKRVVASGEVSPDAETWLENAVNPFPDYETHPVGVPSDTTAHTAVKHIQKQITITAPPGTAGTWTTFVCLMPYDAPNTGGIATQGILNIATCAADGATLSPIDPFVPASGQSGAAGLLMVFSVDDATGYDPNPFSANFDAASTHVSSISLVDAWYGEGAHRLSSLGWEITDNTSQLYQGGNLVCFRKDSMAIDKSFLVVETGATLAHFPNDNMTMYAGFPNSLESAYRVPGATSWNFKEGAYVSATFNSHLEDFETMDPFGGTYLTADVGSSTGLFIGAQGVGDSGEFRRLANPWCKTHLNHSGAYGTGLAKEVNFTLTVKADMEIIPTATSVLVDFIKPGVAASPQLRNLYSHMSRQIPPAVMRKDNDAGDFFKRMIKVAGPLVKTLFPPAAAFVDPLSGMATRGIDAIQARKEKKRQSELKPLVKPRAGKPNTVTITVTPEEAARVQQMRRR